MTPHKYPPLPQAQRDDDDRIGEILDTVRRIEARMTATSERRAAIFAEVDIERARQDAKFPGQALPVIDLDRDLQAVIASYRSSVMRATRVNDENGKPPSWDWVLIEEVAEALLGLAEMQAGTGTKAAARAELIQVMAVCARILESSHFDDNVIAGGGYKPAASMVTKVTHRDEVKP